MWPKVTTKPTPLQNKTKSTDRHRHVDNWKLKSIGAQNQIPFRRLTLGSNPLHLIANARSVFKSTIYDAHRRATCEKPSNLNCLVTRSSPWMPASQNDGTKRRNTYGTMSMACAYEQIMKFGQHLDQHAKHAVDLLTPQMSQSRTDTEIACLPSIWQMYESCFS